MELKHLDRLSESLREFICEIEASSGIKISVVNLPKLNDGGPFGQGSLEVEIAWDRARIFAPTNKYFPEGAVRHEVLHVQRFLVDGVPKLALANQASNGGFASVLCELDNAIEHLVIVPKELELHPERRAHWEAMVSKVWADFSGVPDSERPLAACMHWTFLRHVLADSPQIEKARNLLKDFALFAMADAFADQLLPVLSSKEEMVHRLFLAFPYIGKDRAALEYTIAGTGMRQKPIP